MAVEGGVRRSADAIPSIAGTTFAGLQFANHFRSAGLEHQMDGPQSICAPPEITHPRPAR